MPQMKPLNWLYYFILFSSLIFIINIFNFFIKLNNKNLNINIKNNKIMQNISWKW